jgi:beta-1,4-mannosyl-glycoprotein beta-1,4-N-acetylglucosaminyltransferase
VRAKTIIAIAFIFLIIELLYYPNIQTQNPNINDPSSLPYDEKKNEEKKIEEKIEDEKKIEEKIEEKHIEDDVHQISELDFDPLFTPEEIQKRYPRIQFKKREKRVKVIDTFSFNKELDFLELRLNELKDVVDFHILAESKWTQHGDPKPLYFNENKARFEKWAYKLIHVIVEDKPEVVEARENEDHLRNCIATRGLALLEQRTKLHDDDIFMIFDMDELPRQQSVKFLSEYTGYPTYTRYCLRWTYYGFFYINPRPTCIVAGVSIHYLIHTLHNKTTDIRMYNGRDNIWDYDAPVARAGWHCSWCFFSYSDYVNKLVSARSGDGTRWGDFPDLLKLDYIKENREKARWFDGSSDGKPVSRDDPYLAPKYALDHADLYGFILDKEVKTPPRTD